MSDQDDEIQNLLNELGDTDDENQDIVEDMVASIEFNSESLAPSRNTEEPDPLDDAEDIQESDISAVMRPIRKSPEEIARSMTTKPEIETEIAPILPLEIEEYKQQLDIVTREVLDACRSDRQEAQEVINDLRTRLTACSGSSGPPPKALVDGLVQAVQVKAGINQNAIKMMDTNARFLASIKPSIKTQNNLTIGSGSEELKRILDSPLD